MRRRDLVWLVTSAAIGRALVAAPTVANAQQPSKVYRVGVLSVVGSFASPGFQGFRDELRGLAYIEGGNLRFEVRMAEGRSERLPALAEELVRTEPDVILAPSAPAAVAVQKLTRSIPIVFFSADPVASGLAASLARPGGNATGLSLLNAELAGKRVELLKEMLPGLTSVAVLWAAPEGSPAIGTLEAIMRETESGARVLGVTLDVMKIAAPDELEGAFAAIANRNHRGLIVLPTPLVATNAVRVTELSIQRRLATIGDNRQFAEAGGLTAYGPNYAALLRRAATYVDKILKGARPADLPVEQPTKFELVINLKTAKALGLTLPPSILARADELIE